MSLLIGKIINVYTDRIGIELIESSDFSYNYNGDSYTLNGINDFITVQNEYNNKCLLRITSIYQKQKALDRSENSKFTDINIADACPVGEWTNDVFKFGITKYPMVGKNVYLANKGEISSIFESADIKNSIYFGDIVNLEYIKFKINLKTLFSNHMAIIGNSGSGKSTTIKEIINSLVNDLEDSNKSINRKNINFILFDVHNEYSNFMQTNYQIIDAKKDISLPLENLNLADWINLVLPSVSIQLPILKNSLKFAHLYEDVKFDMNSLLAYIVKELYINVQTDSVAKRQKIVGICEKINNPDLLKLLDSYNVRFGNFEDKDSEKNFKEKLSNLIKNNNFERIIIDSLDKIKNIESLKEGIELALLWEERKGNNQVRPNCITMMTRVENIISEYKDNLFSSNINKIENYKKIYDNEEILTVVNVSELEDDDLRFFANFFLNQVFNNKKTKNDLKTYNIIFDEAHRYIKEDNNNELTKSFSIFEKIAKEGRKFGIYLTISSQRPGELSKTVLSQCNNFIMHRIKSGIDLENIKKSNPFIDEYQINRLSVLPTGTAVLAGESFLIPLEVKIVKKEEKKDESASPNLLDVWFEKKEI
ncbi:ATP-binding protein [Spiroplasma tabanidicola]|uniref:Helicase HerA central domain-containing protein n=1 Tax=Spiroplasma tabanidicola TaxID=324079 RepID=A0A6I6C7Q5_9MOLU|nr:ATP-binding protein [Spiroplasma tabanidicola]QGS51816.1 hypothetical protein STABA_v1c04530 [Spiroplasma tabanidicola]